MSVFGRKRPARHRRNISAHGINKENTHTHLPRSLQRNKFRSLRFIGEKTIEESTADDVNISYDSVSNSDVDSGNDPRISEHESPVNQDIVQTGGLSKNKHGRISKTKHTKKSFSDRFNRIDFDRNKQSIPITPSNSECQESSSHDQSSCLDWTKLKPKSVMKSPVKRLFASQINSCETEDGIELSNKVDIVSTIATASDTNSGMDDIKETDVSSNFLSDIDHISNSDSDLDPQSPLTTAGVRRSLRIQMLRQILQERASPDKDKNVVSRILVPDTPEDKYGWTLKKYQIRKYLKNKR